MQALYVFKVCKESLKCPIRKRAGFNDEASEDYLRQVIDFF